MVKETEKVEEKVESGISSEESVLATLTRAVLSVRAMHASDREYVLYVSRLAWENVDVGSKYHARHFLSM